MIFLTCISSDRQFGYVKLLIDNLRYFGGIYSKCPVWVFNANPQNLDLRSLESEDVAVLPLEKPATINHYLYADKVFACAQAEALIPSEIQSLVWVSPECLFIQPPKLFDLSILISPFHKLYQISVNPA